MLNRIRVRGKLFLLLTTPLLALLLVVYLGVVDRLDDSSDQAREESIAELADAGSDMSLELAQQRLTGMLVEAGAQVDLMAAATRTEDSMKRWLDSAEIARPYIDDPVKFRTIDRLATQLSDRIAEGVSSERSTTSLLAELSLMSRAIETINSELLSEAGDLDLYRAMFVQGFAGEMQTAATELAIVGGNSIRSGQVSTVSMGILFRADGRLAEAAIEFQDQVDDRYLLDMSELRNRDLIPRVADGQYDTSTELIEIIATGDPDALTDWLVFGIDRILAIHDLSDSLLQDASAVAAIRVGIAHDSAQNFMVLAGSVTLAALLMAVLIGRSISRPLARLSNSAQQLSAEELPALVESMRTGGRVAPPEMSVIESKGRDEVAQLSEAISDIQRVTVEVAQEQSELLHRGISKMFVNLARRNQSLLDRQIRFIDELESTEEDPDQLKNLFRLDHLATRMRRNAESLLVLAGGEPPRRRGQPVQLEAVVRVAISEIEDYARVDVRSIDGAEVPSTVAVDLAHLLSELMENATQLSPPDSNVEVIGQLTSDQTYQFTVTDRGVGMRLEQIADANATLAEPPILGLDMGRSLGFTVVSLIADRLNSKVRLTPTPNGGLTALVSLPESLLVVSSEIDRVAPELAPEAIDDVESDLFGVFGSPHPVPTPASDDSDDLFGGVVSAGATLPKRRPTAVVPDPGGTPAESANISPPAVTKAGLARRVPKEPSTLEEPVVDDGSAVATPSRTPEEVREMLSRYRGGLQRGRSTSDSSYQNDPS